MYSVLSKGAMVTQASRLSDQERREIVEYLTGSAPEATQRPLWMCKNTTPWPDREAPAGVTGWGVDAENTRSISAEQAGITARDLGGLKLRWAFVFPDSMEVRSQPTIVGNTLFVGSQSGALYAMDAKSGCVYWTYQATGEIRGAAVYSSWLNESKSSPQGMLFVGDVFANVYAIDAATGSLRWKVKVDDHPVARIVGTPVLSRERLYVPVGSWGEEIAAASPN
jgi:polyvinyl alcohol dehydrogenase (cytochrome)